MAILKIARMGHPALMGIAEPIADPTQPAVHRLVSDMVETMLDAPGIGLAAPQVHVPARVVVYRVPADRDDGDAGVPLTALINPEIEPLTDEMAEGIEGCLSLPGMAGRVPRFTKIRCRAVGLDGEPFEFVAEGYHARVVQHECDHLDGILYPMRMTDLTSFGFADEMSKGMEESGGPGDNDGEATDG
ncbi:MAG: peptide deformylase [Magnetovibrio sp.]|nr:peptide deformylase [Magnetovibrio sp.]